MSIQYNSIIIKKATMLLRITTMQLSNTEKRLTRGMDIDTSL